MPKLPVLFSAHGNPMNAIRDTPFTRFLSGYAQQLPKPRALAVVSAHWESEEPAVIKSSKPGQLYDFYGFPKELYSVRYPALGSPEVAAEVIQAFREAGIEAREENKRGLDHGVWSPLIKLYPKADIPVVQVSLPRNSLAAVLTLGEGLSSLRERGILIICSGNLVHNLGTADFHRALGPAEDWALEFDAWVKKALLDGDRGELVSLKSAGTLARQAHPSPEHYAPLLAAVGAAGPGAKVSFPFEGFEHGTISMRCVRFD